MRGGAAVLGGSWETCLPVGALVPPPGTEVGVQVCNRAWREGVGGCTGIAMAEPNPAVPPVPSLPCGGCWGESHPTPPNIGSIWGLVAPQGFHALPGGAKQGTQPWHLPAGIKATLSTQQSCWLGSGPYGPPPPPRLPPPARHRAKYTRDGCENVPGLKPDPRVPQPSARPTHSPPALPPWRWPTKTTQPPR